MRILKLGAITLGAIIAVIALALIATLLLVNPNQYKGRLEQVVQSATGRQLTLAGPLHLSVFPWIGLELGPASLGNPPGFSTGTFVSVQHAALRVKLLPLLHKRLEIGRVEIDGLRADLEKDARGRGNWQGLIGGGSSAGPASAPALEGLAGVVIRNGLIRDQGIVADHVNLTVGRFSSGTPVPVSLSLDLTPRANARPMELSAKLLATADPSRERYSLASVELGGTVHAVAAGPAVPWQLEAPTVSIDVTAQTFSVPSLKLEVASAHIAASVRGTHILGAPVVSAAFKLDPTALRKLMSSVGYPLPDTRDPRALSAFAASGDLRYGDGAIRASNLDVRLDDSTLRGSAAITDLHTEASRFDLTIDQIDLDRYRGPPATGPQPAGEPTTLPTKLLEALQTQGSLAIGRATVATVPLSDVHVGIHARDGVLHISPARASLYGGSYSGDITVDVRGHTPQTALDQTMTNIDVAQLLAAFTKSRRLSGRGNVTARLTARGSSLDAMLQTLNGHVAADLAHGAVEGFDLWFEIERVISLAQKRALPPGGDSGHTAFDTFRASADVTNGIASTHDLDVASQSLRVTGGGTVNLVTQAIDYRLAARLSAGPTAAGLTGDGSLLDVPVTITGTLTSPKVRPDLAGLAQALLREQLRRRKGNLEKQLLDRLKGLLK